MFKENLHVKSHMDFPISELDKNLGGSCTKVCEYDRERTSHFYTTRSKVKALIGLVGNPRGHVK